ncbi:hypothetical protein FRC03_008954, partial [Tulasnella sp. 419]
MRTAFSPTFRTNVIRQKAEASLVPSVWNVLNSPSQYWRLIPKERGFFIQNVMTGTFLGYERHETLSDALMIKCLSRPVEWIIDVLESTCLIRLASNTDFVLDVDWSTPTFDPEGGIKALFLGTYNGNISEKWVLEKVEVAEKAPYCPYRYIGPVPAGVYWLGHADEKEPNMSISPSVAAITVAARFPLDIGHTTHIQLSGIGDAPWPNQIWELESGVHGYRLKNLGTASYLNYVDRRPVMESVAYGNSFATEWAFVLVEEKRAYPSYHIKPVSDLSVVLGCVQGESFNKMSVSSIEDLQSKAKPSRYAYTHFR